MKTKVLISRGQSQKPANRKLEENLADELVRQLGLIVVIIPDLYDLVPSSKTMSLLRSLSGDLVVVSWIYSRSAHWILDRNEIHGHVGQVLLVNESDEDEDEQPLDAQEQEADEAVHRVSDDRPLPDRKIYCLDFRDRDSVTPFVEEISRIVALASEQSPGASDLEQTTSLQDLSGNGSDGNGSDGGLLKIASEGVTIVDEVPDRRWYPVIDYTRCTNCMECIDFCLFGVYGLDPTETILVEEQDNCRKGCPACSRVCPESAIIFPHHKSPAIAGSPGETAGGLKIDLSLLFGGDNGADAITTAATERDEQLLLAGRQAVGMEVGIPKRQTATSDGPKDELDLLMDQLDEMNI